MTISSWQKTQWHAFEAWHLESERLQVIVVPAAGGKLVSLFDRAAGYEWLVSPAQSNPFRALPYGAEYNPQQMGGWDEMFPTIIAGPYPAPGARQGAPLPDHGELWTLPWSAPADRPIGGPSLCLQAAGCALPYRLTRTLSLSSPEALQLDYELENTGAEPLSYLWAAHPQFVCEPGAEIVLPPEAKEVVNVLPLEWGAEWGPTGTHNAWPEKLGADGRRWPQNKVGPTSLRRGRKFYLPPDRPIAWAGLWQPNAGSRLRLEWDTAPLPYCGVWIDEGYLNQTPAVAIEPTTGYYDDLALAWKTGRASALEAGGRRAWRLTARLVKEF